MNFFLKLSHYLSQRDRGWVLSLIAAVFLLYLPFLGNPFIFDDVTFFLGGAAKQYGESWFNFQLRWLPYASLGWTEAAFSNVLTHTFRLGNLLIHAANVILLFYWLRLLTRAVTLATNEPEPRALIRGAWFGALIFAAHPVAVYAAGYVIQRSILLATGFVLLMQLSYLRALLTGQTRWLALAVAAYFLAVFSKEHSVMAPALLLAQTLMLRGRIQLPKLQLYFAWVGFALIAVLIALIAKGVLGAPYEAMAASLFEQQGVRGGTSTLLGLSIMTQMGLYFKYLLLWLVPNPAWMSIDMREPFISSLTAWQGWLGATGFAVYGALGFWLLLRSRRWAAVAGFALLYPWLQFLLEFSSVRVQEPFVLYRSYLWMPGLMLLVPLLHKQFPGRKIMLALGVVVLLLFAASLNRLWIMSDNYRLWNDAVSLLPDEHTPGADRIYFNRGQALSGARQWNAAIADFERVVALSPQLAPPHFELGWTYAIVGRYEEAMVQFDRAIAIDPKLANAYYGKAMLYKMRNDPLLAKKYMQQACELKNAMACLLTKGHIEH